MGWDNQAITQLIISAAAVGEGVFVYSGAPANGNLVVAISGDGAQTDQYGNPYAGVLSIGNTGQLSVNSVGDIFGFNGFGAQTLYIQPKPPVIILYADNNSAVQGAVTFAVANQTYVDAFSNTINPGVTLTHTATPATPASGQVLYVDASGNLNSLTQNGNTRTIALV